ncbi:MAG: transcription initiation factor IIB [Nitrosopumilaceae archaeon]
MSRLRNNIMPEELTGIIYEKCKNDPCSKGPLITDNVTGEVLCGKCGLVLVEKSEDAGPEFRRYDLEGYLEQARTGGLTSLMLHDRGLSTVINLSNKDASGNLLTTDLQSTFKRLRIWNYRSQVRGKERALMKAFTLLDILKTKIAIPEMIAEDAAYIFRKAMNKKMTTGRSIPELMCASLYAACREANTPRTLNDIAEVANLKKKTITRNYRLLIKSLDLKVQLCNSSEFVTKISTQVGISEKTRRDALDLLSEIEEKELSAGKNPVGLAASSLYLSCLMNGEKKRQDDIAKAAGITVVTIRNRCASLRKSLGIKVVKQKGLKQCDRAL